MAFPVAVERVIHEFERTARRAAAYAPEGNAAAIINRAYERALAKVPLEHLDEAYERMLDAMVAYGAVELRRNPSFALPTQSF